MCVCWAILDLARIAPSFIHIPSDRNVSAYVTMAKQLKKLGAIGLRARQREKGKNERDSDIGNAKDPERTKLGLLTPQRAGGLLLGPVKSDNSMIRTSLFLETHTHAAA